MHNQFKIFLLFMLISPFNKNLLAQNESLKTTNINTPHFSCASDSFIKLNNITFVQQRKNFNAIPIQSLVVGNTYSGFISVPPNYTLSGKFTFDGTIQITTPLTFSLAECVMGEGTQIMQNQPLNIFNSYLHACNKMWKGITSNAKLTIQHSFIEDAQTAIQSNIPNHPGISLNDVIFNKNHTALAVANTINASSPYNFRVTNCLFTTRQIPPPTMSDLASVNLWRNIPAYSLTTLNTTPTALLLGSSMLGIPNTIRSQTGIAFSLAKFTNNNPLVVGQWTNNHAQINIFDNLGSVAISSTFGAQISIQDNYFNNFLAGPDPAGAFHKAVLTGISAKTTVGYSPLPNSSAITNTFVNCLTGVYASANASLSVTNNSFVSNGIAVEIELMSQSGNNINVITKNNFQNCNYDVKSTNNKAIQLLVQDNKSTYVASPFSKLLPVYNVYAAEPAVSALVGYTVNANDFRGKRVGGVFMQNIQNAYISSNYIEMVPSLGGTNYVSNIQLENTFNISVTDNTLSCNPSATSNWNNFGILNSLGTNNEFCGNIINKVGICMKHQGSCPSIITNNTFNNNLADKALIGIWLAINGFVGDIAYTFGNIPNAPAGNIFGNKQMKFTTQYDFQIADTYVSHGFPASTGSNIYVNPFPTFNNPYMPLVNIIDPGISCLPPANCTPFNVINSIYPNQIATCQNLPFSNKLSPGIPKFISNSSAVIPFPVPKRVAEKAVFEFIRKNQININAYTNGTTFVSNEASSNHGIFIRIDSLAEQFVQSKNNNLLIQAKNLNNSVVPAYPSDITQKNFNAVYLTFIQNDSLITPAHIDTLRSIAGKCPFTDGTAVYQARALLSKYDTLVYYNGCEITNVNGSSSRMLFSNNLPAEDDNKNLIMLYPNPAKESITVVAPLGSKITISDISGKILIQDELKESVTKVISVKEWSEGVYLYHIRKDEKLLKSDKLILMK